MRNKQQPSRDQSPLLYFHNPHLQSCSYAYAVHTPHLWGDTTHMLRSVLLAQSELLTVSVVEKSEHKFLTPSATFL